jgi:hypothetical protein
MINRNDKTQKLYIIFSLIILVTLIVGTALRSQAPFWDEFYYLENVVILENLGFTEEFLVNYKGPAGPTYSIIHYFLKPITMLQAPMVRLVNIVFLIGTLLILYRIFLNLNKSRINSIVFALSSLAIPTIYTISGLALTEIFAIFFLTTSLFFITKSYQTNKNNYWLAIISGLSFSFAILGRQPILVLWLALPILFLKRESGVEFDFSKREFLKFIIVTVLFSLIFPLYVFCVWGNIQPASEAFTGVGLSPRNLILAFGYAAIFTFLINPNYFILKRAFLIKKELLLVIFISVLINFFILKIKFTPFKSILSNFLNDALFEFYEIGCGSFLSVVGISYIYFMVKKQLKEKNRLSVFFLMGFLLVIATSIKVTHQFSARYVAQAFPLLVVGLNINRQHVSVWSIVCLTLAGALGLLSLSSYFY